jgi:hypothetical protein
MKSNVKRIVAALLIVPALVLGLGVFGAVPAYAAKCNSPESNNFTGKCQGENSDQYYVDGKPYDNQEAFCNALGANTVGISTGIECGKGTDQVKDLTGSGGIITTVINVMLFVVGILCVIMIVFAGIRYATSAGDKQKVDNAKNTIIYAVVGLIVAMIAYALVNWVFGALSSSS